MMILSCTQVVVGLSIYFKAILSKMADSGWAFLGIVLYDDYRVALLFAMI